MTELQIGLVGLGATAVVGVFAFNKWQEYRHRKLAEQVLHRDHEDVLLDESPRVPPVADDDNTVPVLRNEPEFQAPADAVVAASAHERREPVFGDETAPALPVIEEPVLPQTAEPVIDTPEVPADLPPPAIVLPPEPEPEPVSAVPPIIPTPAAPLAIQEETPEERHEPPPSLLDPRIEMIATMELVEPVRAAQVMASQRDVLQRITRPIHWIAFNPGTREWEKLKPDSEFEFRRLRVGLQLVNRLGPVSDADLVVYVGAMQALADELMAVVELPSTRVQELAAELDRFSAEVDLEIGINLISKGVPFSGTKIRALAEAAGMVLGADGLFTRYDDAGHAQFSLQNMETTLFSAETIRSMSTHGLTFLLDVPRVAHGERVFMQMIELCKRFSETLQGVMVDDNRVPLGDPQIDHIRREFVGKPQAAMNQYQLPAGSPQALRLFS